MIKFSVQLGYSSAVINSRRAITVIPDDVNC